MRSPRFTFTTDSYMVNSCSYGCRPFYNEFTFIRVNTNKIKNISIVN